MTETESNDAWLGLLKWSLNYVDGTVPSSESSGLTEMTAEKRAFLEEVMKNGIIDEGQRMKTILSSLVQYLDHILLKEEDKIKSADKEKIISKDEVKNILFELQDIVEQIDYAKSFAAMGGIKFLLGCSTCREVPEDIKSGCLAVLSTLCQNNPPVQFMMLEHGAIMKLLDLYSTEVSLLKNKNENNRIQEEVESSSCQLGTKIMQVLSSSVRNHEAAERILCMNTDSVKVIESGLGLHSKNEATLPPDSALRQKTLFFLQALVTSDSADYDRLQMFSPAIQFVASDFLDPERETSQEMREMALSMLLRVLEKKQCVNSILDLKNSIVSLGIKRIHALRQLDGEDEEYAKEELNLWESLVATIARASRD